MSNLNGGNPGRAVEETLEEESATAPAPDPVTAQGAPYKRTTLPALEQKARLKFCQKVYNRSRGSRKPEGVFDFDSGKWLPTVREDLGVMPPRPCAPQKLKGWAHIYYLCQRACDGHEVPPDIAEAHATLWPAIHEEFFVTAVDEARKAADNAHDKKQRAAEKRARLLADAAVAESRQGRIKTAEARVAAYNATIKKHMAKVKALETRRARALRSIATLKRFEEKEKTP